MRSNAKMILKYENKGDYMLNIFNSIKDYKEELEELDKEIEEKEVLLEEQEQKFDKNQEKIKVLEKKVKELDKQIMSREKFLIDAELKYIDNLNGFEFEKYITELFNKLEYSAITTKCSNDDGVDVIATKDNLKYAIQCKNYSSPVGNKAVQEVYTAKGITNSDVAIVLTNNPSFTSSAIKEASVLNVQLWNRDKLTELLYVAFHFDFRNIDKLYKINSKVNKISNTNIDEDNIDPLLKEAVELVFDLGEVSTALVQRNLKIGYARAGRLLEQMEALGVISEFEGSKPRKILMTKEQWQSKMEDL